MGLRPRHRVHRHARPGDRFGARAMAAHEARRARPSGNSLKGQLEMGARLMLKGVLTRVFAVAVATLVAGAGAQAQQKTFSIGTGGTGGVYYPLGGAMANVLTKYLPGVQAAAEG